MTEIKNEIKDVVGLKKMNFNYKTTSILKSLFCCLSFRKRSALRTNPRHRNILYFSKAFERLDKELDLSYFIKSLRKAKYLMKVFLDKD